MTTAQTISRLDIEINAVTRLLRSQEKIRRLSAASWQQAWDKHPALYARHCELYRQRGIAQQERDVRAHAAWKAQQRRERARCRMRKCPTCRQHTLTA